MFLFRLPLQNLSTFREVSARNLVVMKRLLMVSVTESVTRTPVDMTDTTVHSICLSGATVLL